ncbi:MAG: CheY-P-specific phosphatase CheC, partial [Thermovirga sp.]|nr:CheY-P-specific phosphatase CheC [Thermovirga sp.]
SALGDFLGVGLHPEVPSIAFDMLGSILDIMISIFGEVGDTAFVLNTSLSFPDLEHQRIFTGKILMVPAPGTFEKIFSIMGVS